MRQLKLSGVSGGKEFPNLEEGDLALETKMLQPNITAMIYIYNVPMCLVGVLPWLPNTFPLLGTPSVLHYAAPTIHQLSPPASCEQCERAF